MENGTAPYGVTALWSQGDIVTHATLVILVLMSVASWSVIAVKAVEQSLLLRQARRAGRLFWAARSLEDAPAALAPGSAFRDIAQAGIEADRLHRSGSVDGMDRHGWVSLALRRAARRVLAPLQGGLTLLASVASTAPFVGLFGTVWGIYHALTAIGVSGQASIDKVAGPVGEALIMTAIGLVVAVPAVLGYNLLGRRNRKAAEAVQGFAADLHAVLLGGTWAGGGERAGRPRFLERTA